MICLSTNPLCSLRTVSFLVQLLWSVARKIWFDIKRHLVAQCRRKRRPERERSNWNTFQTAPTQNEKIFLPAPYANVGHHRWIERNWVISRLFKLRALMKFVRTRRGTFRLYGIYMYVYCISYFFSFWCNKITTEEMHSSPPGDLPFFFFLSHSSFSIFYLTLFFIQSQSSSYLCVIKTGLC